MSGVEGAMGERPRAADLVRLAAAGALVLLLAIFTGVSVAVAGEGAWPQDAEDRYYARFDPSAVPWQPAEEMNIEEVFKNWQYFAIRYQPARERLTVQRFERGRPVETSTWRRRADGGLERVGEAGR